LESKIENPKSKIGMRWQLIVDPALDGRTNMEVDAALLDEAENAAQPTTVIRFYQWMPATLSLGRHQKLEQAADLEFCGEHGIPIVHRPTGGRAVLHDDELTYAVASNELDRFNGASVYQTYRSISEALRLGLERLGVPAVLAPETRKLGLARNGPDHPCFASPSRYELTANARKIIGSAQRRRRRSFLQHGSILITCDRDKLARATRVADAETLAQAVVGIAELLGRRPSTGEMLGAFVAGFQEHFAVEFVWNADSPPRRGVGLSETPS